jgi:hypothetical protein
MRRQTNGRGRTMARPTELWGDPDSPTFYHDYVVMVTFMGKRVPWHKWAVAPLMLVQSEIQASGTAYNFYDLQVYNNRFIAGTHIKSNHSWALAMDINPAQNPWKKPLTTDIPQAIRDAFTRHGFKWGGTYPTPDCMHFEYLGLPVKQEDDMTDEQWKTLKQLRLSALAQSHDVGIMKALIAGDTAKATQLETAKATAVAAEKARLGL